MTAKPRPSAVVGLSPSTVSPVTEGAEPDWRSMPQLAPWVISSLWLNCGCGAHGSHGCAGLEERGDLVLVAVLVARLDADDEGDGLAGLGRGLRDVARRLVGVVLVQLPVERGLVLVAVGGGLVALGVRRAVGADPRLDLRAGEDGAAVGVVGDRDAGGVGAGGGDELVGADVEPGDQALEASVGPDGERAGDVAAVLGHPDGSPGRPPSMATSASPAEIRSARFETTSIFNAALALAGAIRSAVSAATSVLMASHNGTRAANLR